MGSLTLLLLRLSVFLLALSPCSKAVSDDSLANGGAPQNKNGFQVNLVTPKKDQDGDLDATRDEGMTAPKAQETGGASKDANPSDSAQDEAGPSKAFLPGKIDDAKAILTNPPPSFTLLLRALPFSIYGVDKHSNYVAICSSSSIDWEVVNSLDPQEMTAYIKYVALFFWMYVDKRASSSLSVIVNAKGFSLMKVLDGSAKTILKALISGLNETIEYVGKRPGRVFIVNAPSFLCPVINMTAKLARSDVQFVAHGKQEQWEPILREQIGKENLPLEYGGTNPLKAENSRILTHMKSYVKKQLDREVARRATKGLK